MLMQNYVTDIARMHAKSTDTTHASVANWRDAYVKKYKTDFTKSPTLVIVHLSKIGYN
jgi:hypothetical protein